MCLFKKKGFISNITEKAIKIGKHSKKTIVFPETEDTILKACSEIIKKKIAFPLIMGDEKHIKARLEALKIKNIKDEHILDHLSEKNKEKFEIFANEYINLRKLDGKEMTLDYAKAKISQPHYYAAMLLKKDEAEGVISGINSATKPYYPAFEIIKTKEGISRASGVFIMTDKSEKNVLFFADCVLNIVPTAEQLAEIAYTTSQTAIELGIKPKVAMLSFSTRASAKHELIDKVRTATELVKQKDKDLIVDGEIQIDAAIVPEVMKRKCPDSVLEGNANVLIFPDLNSGNTGYKLVERLAGYKAIGPIMQGLNKPLNDLSRGCSVQDVVDLCAITVIQSL